MSDPGADLLILDPSVFLGDEGFDWLLGVPAADAARFVVPATFYEQLALHAPYTEADEELWGPFPDEEHARPPSRTGVHAHALPRERCST